MERNPEKIATDPVLVNAVNAWLQAKAFLALERERVAPIHAELLRVWKPTATRNGRPGELITDFRQLYLCEDEDLCQDIYRDMDRMYREAGWKDLKPGYCPALIADDLLTKANWAVVEAMRQWFPDVTTDRLLCAGMDKYRQYIDLAVKMVVNHPKYRKPTIAA